MVDSAELFDALSHPVRIRILKILDKQPSSFASLKRQLGIDSSGNLDHHLKKLSGLVIVQKDGLYGLTAAGKEALLSIDDVEMWTETEKRKMERPRVMPKEVFFLGLLELCSTASLFWFFVTIMQAASWKGPWGFLFFGGLLITGLSSGLGAFRRWEWSWSMLLIKATSIMSIGLLLLAPMKSNYEEISYLGFVAVEVVAFVMASRHPLTDFLGLGKRVKASIPIAISSILCISSGIVLILLFERERSLLQARALVNGLPPLPSLETVFGLISDASILCGLLIVVGGVLILLGKNARVSALGAATSIIFGFFPSREWGGYHIFDIITMNSVSSMLDPYYALYVAVFAGILPIVGGLLALLALVRDRGIH